MQVDEVRFLEFYADFLLRCSISTRCLCLSQLHPLQTGATPIKHSSSAVDLVVCIQPICQLWEKLLWPDPEEAFMLMVKITEVRNIQVVTLFQVPWRFFVKVKNTEVPSKMPFSQMELEGMCLAVDKDDVMILKSTVSWDSF